MEHGFEWGGDWENAKDYIIQMNEDLESVDHVIKTGNIMADAIVNSKVSLAKKKDIRLNVTARIPKEIPMTDVEFCVVFGNIMDNAIEACEKNQKEKRIICRIAREADEVNIFVENSIEQSVLAENQSLETTKEKKDQHGMGHLIVEEQVKRLGGMVEYYEDEMFCVHVYLPV